MTASGSEPALPPQQHERKNHQLDPNPALRDITSAGSNLDGNTGSLLSGNLQIMDLIPLILGLECLDCLRIDCLAHGAVSFQRHLNNHGFLVISKEILIAQQLATENFSLLQSAIHDRGVPKTNPY